MSIVKIYFITIDDANLMSFVSRFLVKVNRVWLRTNLDTTEEVLCESKCILPLPNLKKNSKLTHLKNRLKSFRSHQVLQF